MTPDFDQFLTDLAPLVLVGGKGGVGKSFVTTRLAESFDERGERVVAVRFANDGLADTQPKSSYREVVLDPTRALRDQAARIIGSQRLARLVLDQRAIRGVLDLIPGVNEVALLLTVQELAEQYDRVVVDLPATGHGGSWLQAPRTLLGVVDRGRAMVMTTSLAEHFEDPNRTSFVLVTTTEPFVLLEAERLSAQLLAEAHITTAAVVVNRAPQSFDESARRAAWSLAASRHPAASEAARMANLLSEREIARARSAYATSQFGEDVPVVTLAEGAPPTQASSAAA